MQAVAAEFSGFAGKLCCLLFKFSSLSSVKMEVDPNGAVRQATPERIRRRVRISIKILFIFML
jgi:hypothetical protein